MGGLFTPQPSALPTNIRCLTSSKRVIGFVGCSMNTSDYRFFLHPGDFSLYRPGRKDTRLWLENPSDAECCRLASHNMYLSEWDDERMFGGKLRTAWAYLFELDVRALGAYIDQPYYWTIDR
jgi:hypothetical protein